MSEGWLEYNKRVWRKYDSRMNVESTVHLIRLQCNEIEEHLVEGHDIQKVVNELCDIASLASRQIEILGFDFVDEMFRRIRTRYDGRVEEIIDKYRKLD